MMAREGYRFAEFRIESAGRLLWRNDERVPLTPLAFDTLFCLVKASGRVVTKEELLETIWPDAHVEEGNLTQNISVLRRALGKSDFIETIPKRGYRFSAPVEEIREEPDPPEPSPVPLQGPVEPPIVTAPPRRRLTALCALALGIGSGYWLIQRAARNVPASIRSRPSIQAELDYVRGREFWRQRTLVDLEAAMLKFQQAVDRDPGYALAYSGLADSLILLGSYNVHAPKDIFPRARAAAMDALRLDDRLAEAHASLAAIRGGYDWDWNGAEKEFQRAIRSKPEYPTAHQWYAEQLSALARHTEAIAEARAAVQLEPHSPTTISLLGLTYYFARRYDDAMTQYRLALQFNRSHLLTWFFLGYLYEQQGKFEEAVSAFQKAVELAQGAGMAHLGHAQALSGNRREAMAVLERLQARAANAYVSPLDIAMVHIGLGDREAAFTWLERAYEDHSQWLEQLKVDPRYDALRSDSRFHVLLKRIHLE